MFSGWFGGQQQQATSTSSSSSAAAIPGVHETIMIDSTMEQAMKVITDYDSYTKFLKNLDEVKVVHRSDDGKVCDVKWKVTVTVKTVTYTLRLTENAAGDGITWEVSPDDSGPFSKNTGGWRLRTVDVDGEKKVEATYYMDVDFNVWLPGFLKDMLLGKSLPETMNAFKKRIEEHAA